MEIAGQLFLGDGFFSEEEGREKSGLLENGVLLRAEGEVGADASEGREGVIEAAVGGFALQGGEIGFEAGEVGAAVDVLLFEEFVEKDGAVSASAFGFVQGEVGGLEEMAGHAGGVGELGGAEGGGDFALGAVGALETEFGDVGADAFAEGAEATPIHAGEDEGELFSTVAGGEVNAADAVAEGFGDEFEDFVTGVVAFFLVELAEVVHVEHDDADGAVAAFGFADAGLEHLLHGAVVGDAGERVVAGEPFHALEQVGGVEGEGKLFGDGDKDLLVAFEFVVVFAPDDFENAEETVTCLEGEREGAAGGDVAGLAFEVTHAAVFDVAQAGGFAGLGGLFGEAGRVLVEAEDFEGVEGLLGGADVGDEAEGAVFGFACPEEDGGEFGGVVEGVGSGQRERLQGLVHAQGLSDALENLDGAHVPGFGGGGADVGEEGAVIGQGGGENDAGLPFDAGVGGEGAFDPVAPVGVGFEGGGAESPAGGDLASGVEADEADVFGVEGEKAVDAGQPEGEALSVGAVEEDGDGVRGRGRADGETTRSEEIAPI